MDPPSPAPPAVTGVGAWPGLVARCAQRSPQASSTAHALTGTAGSGPCTDLGFRVLPLIQVLFDTLRAGPQLKHSTHNEHAPKCAEVPHLISLL